MAARLNVMGGDDAADASLREYPCSSVPSVVKNFCGPSEHFFRTVRVFRG
jgi:hypothetical protein